MARETGDGSAEGFSAQEQPAVVLGIPGYDQPTEIGRGGFAVVYRAWEPAFQRHVAIKLISALQDRVVIDRFDRECQAVGAVSGHPNIVTVYGHGRTAEDRPFIVMEFLSGGSWADWVAQGRTSPTSVMLSTGVKMAGALESAHRAGILHRDVKPANVLISRFGEPKLADFGIASIEGGTVTRSGTVTATFVHAAPEVISGKRPTVGSDIYSLASTLFELLSGRPPFVRPDDEGLAPLFARVISEPVPDLRPAGVPADLCAVLEQAMAKDPSERPETALEFGQNLRAVEAKHGTGTTPMPLEDADGDDEQRGAEQPRSAVVDQPVTASPTSTTAPPDRPAQVPVFGSVEPVLAGNQRRRDRRVLVFVAPVLVVLLVAVILVVSLTGGGDDPPGTGGTSSTTVSGPGLPGGEPVLADDFSDPTSGWLQPETEEMSGSYVDGQYRMAVQVTESQQFIDTAAFAVPRDDLDDVSVEVDAIKQSGEDGYYGVVCRKQPGSFGAHYFGVIDGRGNFRVGKYGSSGAQLIDSGYSRLAEPRRIRLDCAGGAGDSPATLRLFVNGEPVSEKQDSTPLRSGAVGLTVHTLYETVEVLFDDFAVNQVS